MSPYTKLILQFLRYLGKMLPFLGKLIERVSEFLLHESPTSEEIIRTGLAVGAENTEGATQTGEGDTETMGKEEARLPEESPDHGQSDANIINSTRGGAAAQELALRQIAQGFEDNRQRMRARLDHIETQDAILFRVMLVAGVLSLALILWGAYEFYKNGADIVGVLSELVGLLGGAGTIILRRLQRDVRDKAERLERQEDEQTAYLRTIQATLALTGSEREGQLTELARTLREAMPPAAQQRHAADGASHHG